MKKLFMFLCLPLFLAACSDKEEIEPEPGPIGPDDNASGYVEFKGNVMPITRALVDETEANTANLYAWTQRNNPVGYSNTDLIYYERYGMGAYFIVRPDYALLRRNADDPTIWENSRNEEKIKWSDYRSNPLSFFAVIGEANTYKFEEITRPHKFVRKVKGSYDKLNDEYNFQSGDLHDLMFAYTADCTAEEFEEKKEVPLNFRHMFPRVMLNAHLGKNNALEVKVKHAQIYGLQVNGHHLIYPTKSFEDNWTCNESALSQVIEMEMAQSVTLTADPLPLVDAGKEPHVLPQSVKPWTNLVCNDGVGIILDVIIRNLNDNSYIVGTSDRYESVFVPFPVNKLEMGHMYNIDLEFGTTYRENGTATGYKLSYQPQIVDWDVESENVELKR